jgi:hypothetical protein
MLSLPESAVSAFGLNGYVVVPDVFDPEPVRLMLEKRVEEHVAQNGRMQGGGYRPDVIMEPDVQALYVDPVLLGFAEKILGCAPAFGSLGSNVIPAGALGMEAHVDYPYFSMARMPDGASPALCVQTIWYPEDVTEDFAPTAVVPGSHLRPSKPDPERFREEAVPVLAKAGSLFIGHGATWHAVMPNRTGRNRPAVLGSYVPYWVRPMLRVDVPEVHPTLRILMCSNFGERIGRDYERNSVKVSDPTLR